MSHKSWTEQLKQIIQSISLNKHIAIVGIGHELRGDDAVGIEIVRYLQRNIPATDRVLICDAGAAPENITGMLRRFKPNVVLLIDAVQMNTPSGTIHLMDVCNTEGFPSSTHSLPLTLLAQYLQSELDCNVALLGIQPESLSFVTSLSRPVYLSKIIITRTLKVAITREVRSISSNS